MHTTHMASTFRRTLLSRSRSESAPIVKKDTFLSAPVLQVSFDNEMLDVMALTLDAACRVAGHGGSKF